MANSIAAAHVSNAPRSRKIDNYGFGDADAVGALAGGTTPTA